MGNHTAAQTLHAWQAQLRNTLPLFGHRNWVVIADAAYPAQLRQGIDTILSDAGHLDVLRTALDSIAGSPHLRATLYTDYELAFLNEADAPGIQQYRRDLETILKGCQPRQLAHEELIARLDAAAQKFRVLVIKTRLLLPYTSVFLELDCGYWNPEAEQRLREAIVA